MARMRQRLWGRKKHIARNEHEGWNVYSGYEPDPMLEIKYIYEEIDKRAEWFKQHKAALTPIKMEELNAKS